MSYGKLITTDDGITKRVSPRRYRGMLRDIAEHDRYLAMLREERKRRGMKQDDDGFRHIDMLPPVRGVDECGPLYTLVMGLVLIAAFAMLLAIVVGVVK